MTHSHLLLYDGVCGLCNHSVNFILKQEKEHRLVFAPLQSKLAKELGIASTAEPESLVLVISGTLYTSSTAALLLVKYLNWKWQWLRVFWIVPKPFRDAAYGWIAKNRYKWFGKMDACPIPPKEVRNRFVET